MKHRCMYGTRVGLFVDAVEKLLRFADGETLLISDVQSVSFLPPSYVLPVSPSTAPLLKREFSARKHWTFLYIAKEMKAIRFDRLHQIGDLDELSLEELQKRGKTFRCRTDMPLSFPLERSFRL